MLDGEVGLEEIGRGLLEALREIVVSYLLLANLSSHLLDFLLQQKIVLLEVLYLTMVFICEEGVLLLQ
jgi:hypothetical protein